jgi:hypothetical protein
MEDLTNGGPPKLGSLDELWGASGFTPVDDSFPTMPVQYHEGSDPDQIANNFRQDYQRRLLLGFTTHELENLDVITRRQLKPSNLPPSLHQLFGRNKWEVVPPPYFVVKTLYPLPTPFAGNCRFISMNYLHYLVQMLYFQF